MKYACDEPIYDLFSDRENSEDKIGEAKGFWPNEVNSTKDAVKACLHVYGSGTWKRRCKKTYCKIDYRVMEDVDTGKFVTVFTMYSEAHDDEEVTFVFEVNLKEKVKLIKEAMKYCRKHYVEVDGGEVLFNPMTNQLFFVLSDCFAMYVNDSSDEKEVLKKNEMHEEGEGLDWVEDSNNWTETHVDGVSESFYSDEWAPDIINGFFPIGKLKQIDDY